MVQFFLHLSTYIATLPRKNAVALTILQKTQDTLADLIHKLLQGLLYNNTWTSHVTEHTADYPAQQHFYLAAHTGWP
jgi:hypothetical protein